MEEVWSILNNLMSFNFYNNKFEDRKQINKEDYMKTKLHIVFFVYKCYFMFNSAIVALILSLLRAER